MYFTNRTIIIAAMLEAFRIAVFCRARAHSSVTLQDLERNFQLPDKGLQANIKGMGHCNRKLMCHWSI